MLYRITNEIIKKSFRCSYEQLLILQNAGNKKYYLDFRLTGFRKGEEKEKK